MKVHPNEIYILYDPSTQSGKQLRAYAYSITPHVNENYYHSTQMTSTLWREVLDKLGMEPEELFNQDNPEFRQQLADQDWDEEGWLNILKTYPHLIKNPIAMSSTRAIVCRTPSDVLKLSRELGMREAA